METGDLLCSRNARPQKALRSEEHTSELQSPTTLFPYTTLFRSPNRPLVGSLPLWVGRKVRDGDW